MVRYKFTNKAVEDLTKIWNYTVIEWSESQADIYYEMLIESAGITWLVHSTLMEEKGAFVGINIYPNDIHIMHKG